MVRRDTHDTSYKDVFSGWLFLVVMRILAPAFAFWTAGEAALEFSRRQHRQKNQQHSANNSAEGSEARRSWTVRDVMYVAEAPSLMMCGVMLACGQYGPTALPFAWHRATITLFGGTPLFTTLLMALYIRGESLRVRTQQLKKPLLAQHPYLLTIGGSICIGLDLASPIFTALGYNSVIFDIILASLYFVGFVPVQCTVSAFFFSQALKHQRPLLYYVFRRHRAKSDTYGDREASVLRMGRLVTWLAMSAICMLASIYAFGVLVSVVIMLRWVSIRANTLAAHVYLFAFSRIGISYA